MPDAAISADAAHLLEYLNALDRWPTWEEMSRQGVELIDDNSVMSDVMFHLATGETIYPTVDGWDVLTDSTIGVQVQSGTMTRRHRAGISSEARIHPTAQVDPTARVERGAVIGPRSVIQAHAHVGRDARIGAAVFVSAGAFIGSRATVRSGCQIGEGAVVGAGSDVGSTTRIGAGACLGQGTTASALDHVGAGQTVELGQAPTRFSRAKFSETMRAIERLLSLDRG